MRSIKSLIKAVLPASLLQWLKAQRESKRLLDRIRRNYEYDSARFTRWSADRVEKTRANFAALITMDYHRIEKALALREPRPGFGGWFIPRFLENIQKYRVNYGLDRTAEVAINTLGVYERFNTGHGVVMRPVSEAMQTFRDMPSGNRLSCNEGGTTSVSAQVLKDAASLDLQAFFASRHSIRDFSDQEVDVALIEQAVSMAGYTPSVCNRQSWKAYVFSSPEIKQRVLSFQNGNRGFGDQASRVVVVTTDLQAFVTPGERNQCWIDGGMFAMSLVYALHSLGLGTCCLNWSVEMEVDRGMREVAGIPDSEAVIMLIAVGHYSDNLRVAQSARKSLHDVLVFK